MMIYFPLLLAPYSSWLHISFRIIINEKRGISIQFILRFSLLRNHPVNICYANATPLRYDFSSVGDLLSQCLEVLFWN